MSTQLALTFDAPRTAPAKRSAADEIRRVLMDILPAGVPPSFGRVVAARFTGKARVVAELEMVDGLPAQVEAWQWCPDAWAHRWIKLEGGDLSWQNGAWHRVPEDQFEDLELTP
jgi:hypothetical protein